MTKPAPAEKPINVETNSIKIETNSEIVSTRRPAIAEQTTEISGISVTTFVGVEAYNEVAGEAVGPAE